MIARIYKPTRTATQSGSAKTLEWILEFTPSVARNVDPLMGWTSSSDTQAQVILRFPSKETALKYAEEKGIDVQVCDPKTRRTNIRPRGYGENFATNRKEAWTH
ncbi:MAG: ETC complex I subunit [Aestuariivita sp.]|nr:ETC complex I subunit [Aestuariivita sp.]